MKAGTISRTILLVTAALAAVPVLVSAAPAFSTKPYIPDPVEFELRAPPPAGGAVSASGARTVVSRVVRPSKRFNLVGLRWRGAALSTLAVRVRDGGRWGHWTRVPVDPDHAPDRGSHEGGAGWRASDPVWAGEARALQYRTVTRGRIRDLRLHFVNTKGTATAIDRLRTKLRGAVHGAFGTVASLLGVHPASAAGGAPPIVGRDAWGASKCPPRAIPSYGTVKLAFIHHTVSANDYGPGDSAAMVLGICLYHRNSNGWNDIGYNFLVDKYGTIFEGRAGGVDAAVVGAQAQGYNAQSTGISNLGTFSTTGQTEAGLRAMARLLAWKLSIHGVPPTGTTTVTSTGGALNRYPAGTQVTLQRISGHRDGDATACPGDGLYAQLPLLREMTAKVVLPPAPKLSLGADSTRITFGTKAGLRAALAGQDGAPLGGRPLELQVLGRAGWNTLQSLPTDAAGSLSTRLRLAYTHSVRARFAGETGLGSAQSSPVLVGVRPLVQARLDPSAASLARGQQITVAGTVRPHKSSLLMLVERVTPAGRAVRVARRALRARGGRVRGRFRFKRSGSYDVRLAVKPDRRNLSGRSARLGVKVR